MAFPGKKMDVELKKFSVRMDPGLVRAVKVSAATNGRSMQAELDGILRSHYGIPKPGHTNGKAKAKPGPKSAKAVKLRPSAREPVMA